MDEATSARAALLLTERGYTQVYALRGGWNAWLAAGLPTESSKLTLTLTAVG